MENMVDNVSSIETPQADTAVAEATYADFLAEQSTPEEVAVEKPEVAEKPSVPQADVAEKTYTQKDFDAAVRAKISAATKDMERRQKTDPRIALADFFMQQTGEKDPVKAAEKAIQDAIQKQSEALVQDPTVMAQMLLRMQAPQFKQETEPDVKESADRIALQVIECVENEELPADFNPVAFEKSNPGFLDYAARRGVSAAYIKFNKNTPTLAAALAQAHALPPQTKPTAKVETGSPDFGRMSPKEFAAYKEWRLRQNAMGRPVND